MQQQQDSEPRGDIVGARRNECSQHDIDQRSVDTRNFVGSPGIDAGGINTRVASGRQGHADLLEWVYRW
jgi:hypothetical protein